MLAILISTISNSQVFLLKNVETVAFADAMADAKATYSFSAKILAYMPNLMIKV